MFEGLDIHREILNIAMLIENTGIATLSLSGKYVKASDNLLGTFNAISESMREDFGETFS